MTYSVYTLASGGVINSCFSPDGTRLYASSGNGDIAVYDVAEHKQIATWHVDGSLTSISVSDDGKYLLAVGASPDWSGFARFNTANGHAALVQESSPGGYLDIQVVNDHEAILSGSGAYRLDRVDFMTGSLTTIASGPGPADVSDLCRDGHLTLMADKNGSNGALYLYNGVKDKVVASGDDYQDGAVSGFNFGIQAISKAGKFVAQSVGGDALNIYDLNLHPIKVVQVADNVGGIAFDTKGHHLFVYDADSGLIRDYRTTDWTVVKMYQVAPSAENSNYENCADSLLVSADDKHLVVTDYRTGAVTLVDLTKLGEALPDSSEHVLHGGRPLIGLAEASFMHGGALAHEVIGHLLHPIA